VKKKRPGLWPDSVVACAACVTACFNINENININEGVKIIIENEEMAAKQ
jgi:hypothetical protein